MGCGILTAKMQQTGEVSRFLIKNRPDWLFNELRHSGVDYSDDEVAAKYDENHLRFRDFEEETARILDRLHVEDHHQILDMGCGTGAFTLHAAKKCHKIYAVDVSEVMLRHCRLKAEKMGLTNIEFHHAGFLTYVHHGDPVDAIVSVAVLHHLPDYWKGVAFQRLQGMLKPGGRLYLFDIVFPALAMEYEQDMNTWVRSIRERAGKQMAEEAVVHIRDEFSTFDWVLEGMLERTGFHVEERTPGPGFGMTFICQR